MTRTPDTGLSGNALTHLQRLEAESIHIMREVIAGELRRRLAATRGIHAVLGGIADAVRRLRPDAKVAIGPSIETGFYDYVDGKRGSIWSGLAELFPVAEEQPDIQDVRDRMLFAEALETAKTFEEGVITSSAAANIGSIMGIGFPPQTGGAAQFMTGYEAADGEIGLNAFLKRADELAEKYGDRFQATPWLRELAASGKGFPA